MISRRQILKAGAVGAAAALPSIEARAATTSQPENGSAKPTPSAGRSRETLFFFNGEEAKFIEAAIDRLIPGDDHWGGAKAAGVLYYIDGQLSGAYGAGARLYLKGPWSPEASAQHGYQLRYAPAELYRIAIAEIRDHARTSMGGRDVWKLKGEELDSLLSDLENGKVQLPSLPAPVFFETLLANTIEGYFADPAYGGNRDMVSWRMIGFPGAYAQYVELVDQHGYAFTRPPIGIGGGAHEVAHAMNMED